MKIKDSGRAIITPNLSKNAVSALKNAAPAAVSTRQALMKIGSAAKKAIKRKRKAY